MQVYRCLAKPADLESSRLEVEWVIERSGIITSDLYVGLRRFLCVWITRFGVLRLFFWVYHTKVASFDVSHFGFSKPAGT